MLCLVGRQEGESVEDDSAGLMYSCEHDQSRRRRRTACGRGGEWQRPGERLAADNCFDVTVTFHIPGASDDDDGGEQQVGKADGAVMERVCSGMRRQDVEGLCRSLKFRWK